MESHRASQGAICQYLLRPNLLTHLGSSYLSDQIVLLFHLLGGISSHSDYYCDVLTMYIGMSRVTTTRCFAFVGLDIKRSEAHI
jgi:hypothetical protein